MTQQRKKSTPRQGCSNCTARNVGNNARKDIKAGNACGKKMPTVEKLTNNKRATKHVERQQVEKQTLIEATRTATEGHNKNLPHRLQNIANKIENTIARQVEQTCKNDTGWQRAELTRQTQFKQPTALQKSKVQRCANQLAQTKCAVAILQNKSFKTTKKATTWSPF